MFHLSIQPVNPRQIPQIQRLEHEISNLDNDNIEVASLETLFRRQAMFPQGFLVAQYNNTILGYIESCRWNKEAGDFQTFDEIKDFPNQHVSDGENLYILGLAVHPQYRRNGVGSALVNAAVNLASQQKCSAAQLVADIEPQMQAFYNQLGFTPKLLLPTFYPGYSCCFMERLLKPQQTL